MALLRYYKYQNNNSENQKAYKKWYGRVVITETVGIEQLAKAMQDACTVKRADILAVLSELGPTMRDLIQDSKRVTIPYLGSFKLGIVTEGAAEEDDFTAKNVKSIRVNFQPTTHIEPNGRRVKELTDGCRVAEYKNVEPGASNSSAGGSSTGGSTPPTVDPD